MAGIPVTTPVVEPAKASQTYDTFWLSYLQIVATDPNQPVRVMATCQAMGADANGKAVLSQRSKQNVVIPDFFKAATPAELETMAALLTAIKTRAGM